MRRIYLLTSILLLMTLACNITLPDISMPEVDLSQISFGSQQKIDGSGKMVQEKRVIQNFSNVTLAGMGDLVMEQGDSEGIDIQADDNLIQYIRVEVNNGKLVIGIQPGITINPSKPISYHLKIKTIDGINLTGSGSIETPGIIGRSITVNMSGSGHVKILKVDANSITTHLSGSGDIEAGGRIQAEDVTIDGAGNYRSADMVSSTAKINISGSGSAYVQALDQLNATISGSGSVHYIGNPVIKQNISGAGLIVQDK